MDFAALVAINRQVVALTGEPHEYTDSDREGLGSLLAEVESRADNQEFDEAVPEKAALLMFKIASGQHFRSGNKRTALVAGAAFLRKNGYSIDLTNPGLVSMVDKAGMAAATLDELFGAIDALIVKAPTERKGWEGAVTQMVEANRKFLRDLGS
jgi:prophage maintenance system killer protein